MDDMRRVIVLAAMLALAAAGCGKDVHYYIESGNEALREGDFDQAVLDFEKAVEEYPESYEAHNSLGAALSATGNLQRAVEHFSIAVALKDDFVEGHYNLARALSGLGRYKEAVEEYRNAIQVDSTYAIAYMGMGDALAILNEPEQAITSYEEAIQNDPGLLPAYIGLGRVYVSIREYDKAIEVFETAQEAFPRNAEVPFIAGKAAVLSGDPNLAVEFLSDACRLDSLNLYYRNDLGTAYMLAGRKMEAISEWEGILSRSPGPELRRVVETNLERAATEE
jgi:tetratricopeptide (TPR) repeat protein